MNFQGGVFIISQEEMQEKPVVGEIRHLMILPAVWRPSLVLSQLAPEFDLFQKARFERAVKPWAQPQALRVRGE